MRSRRSTGPVCAGQCAADGVPCTKHARTGQIGRHRVRYFHRQTQPGAHDWRRVVVQAYILIQTEVGKAREVANAISGVPGVVRVDAVTGPYDVVVLAEAGTVDELGKMIVSRVQLVPGITRTLTCSVVRL